MYDNDGMLMMMDDGWQWMIKNDDDHHRYGD